MSFKVNNPIIAEHIALKHDPPTIAIFYKRQQTDKKRRMYHILLNDLIKVSDPQQIANVLYQEHPLVINDQNLDNQQLVDIIETILKQVEFNSPIKKQTNNIQQSPNYVVKNNSSYYDNTPSTNYTNRFNNCNNSEKISPISSQQLTPTIKKIDKVVNPKISPQKLLQSKRSKSPPPPFIRNKHLDLDGQVDFKNGMPLSPYTPSRKKPHKKLQKQQKVQDLNKNIYDHTGKLISDQNSNYNNQNYDLNNNIDNDIYVNEFNDNYQNPNDQQIDEKQLMEGQDQVLQNQANFFLGDANPVSLDEQFSNNNPVNNFQQYEQQQQQLKQQQILQQQEQIQQLENFNDNNNNQNDIWQDVEEGFSFNEDEQNNNNDNNNNYNNQNNYNIKYNNEDEQFEENDYYETNKQQQKNLSSLSNSQNSFNQSQQIIQNQNQHIKDQITTYNSLQVSPERPKTMLPPKPIYKRSSIYPPPDTDTINEESQSREDTQNNYSSNTNNKQQLQSPLKINLPNNNVDNQFSELPVEKPTIIKKNVKSNKMNFLKTLHRQRQNQDISQNYDLSYNI